MEIILSKYAGFCFGVRRAVDMINAELDKGEKRIFTLGNIIHNEDFNNELKSRGVINIDEADLDGNLPENSLAIIRTHGVPLRVYEKLGKRKIEYIDLTCPYVKKIHNIVTKELTKADGEELIFIIIGDKSHPEVNGIVSYAGNSKVFVFSECNELESYTKTADVTKKHVFLAQTTQSVKEWQKCLEFVKKAYTNFIIFDTICSVTEERQKDAAEIAEKSDIMLIVGGFESSNTKKLVKVSERYCPTFHISRADGIPFEKIKKNMIVGVTAGASTPDRIIREVIKNMSDFNDENMSFQEMLDQSFKTLMPGEEVTGVITSILPNEIHVDLGVKHTGVLPLDEISDAEIHSFDESFKIGDEITVLVQKFNDAEGTVQVSKKRIDSKVGWRKLVQYAQSGEVLTGKVLSAVKGGIIVAVENQSIFVPASLIGLAKGTELSELVGKTVSFKVIEADQEKRRAIASIKAVIREEKKAAADKLWSEIEIGKTYKGKVKSLTSYGAFVDLGGVDGMVHITELSWQRVKNPSEVVKVGDEITVFVKDFNPETKKISLGYKTEETNPWVILKNLYKPGDVAKVKIISLVPFGAFAQVIPGIDGLIHISQISDKHISKPDEVLNVGDEVEVEISEIDFEAKRVSLSIRALIEKANKQKEEEYMKENSQYIVEEK